MAARRIVLLSHLAAADGVTGAENSLLLLARELEGRGREVHWLSPLAGRSVEAARELGIAVEVLPWPRLFLASYRANPVATALRLGRFVATAPRLPRLARRLRELAPDVILVNTLVNVGGLWAAARSGAPAVLRVAEIPGPGPRLGLLRWCADRYPSRVVAVSEAVASNLGAARSQVVLSGAEVVAEAEVAERRSELRGRLGLPDGAVIIGHVGQLLAHKGQLEFVRAANAQVGGDEVYSVFGSRAGASGYLHALAEHGDALGDRLTFPGFVAGAPAAIDLLVFTSTAPDPFPLTILEAMAAGVAVVAFTGGGVAEAVVDGETGVLVPMGDVEGLAAAIAGLRADPERRREMGRRGRERVREVLSMERTADGYLDVLDAVTDAARREAR